ncbi:hypothetical protein LTR10_024093 [Elasticomyces elasticus]|uniref:Uncharacterized protein n=1 Tax=Exophiala sideris TaxID=1016849 RepID=A0ABR0J8N5_9EURO|nr:hypothetical protein LTR10_024093 [Elasticomyces elasticus]KAK5028001.1 hypothetical protein LTS07_006877 [Exophiala sideris]KAK5037409.1 hypothetical protein LTR13_004566 [Exophiala sideris]KAK5059071.1 hypothetical protein LTR69_006360 [Exophiala sideris]KAK5182904.1 hypothetical protein LTR44_004614 [Eurotiomycetes sp. CCFEE 6388]
MTANNISPGRTGGPSVSVLAQFAALFTSSCVLPIALYWLLKYVAHLSDGTVVTIPLAIFGVVSVFGLLKRTWDLVRPNSDCRPLGGTRWQLDYFHWNFISGFTIVTIIIIVGNILKPKSRGVRICSLPLSLLFFQVCTQLVVVNFMVISGARYPWRISSMPRGTPVRPALYTIVEDVVAVEGGKKERFRASLDHRYMVHAPTPKLLLDLSWIWGIGGLAVAVVLTALAFSLSDVDLAFTLGWSVPWAFVAIAGLITRSMMKATYRKGGFTEVNADEEVQLATE